MNSVNKVILIGNVGSDPEIIHSETTTIANFSIATTETWKDKNGDKQEETSWHRCVAFGGLAEVIEKYITKGKHIYVEGRIKYVEWTDQEGNKRLTTKINCDNMQMLGKKDSN